MVKKIKKSLIVLLSLVMVISLMAGCGSQNPQPANTTVASTQPASTTQAASTVQTNKSGLPIVTEPLTLTYYTSADSTATATMKTYGEIACFKEMEKRTGIHIEFIHPTAENQDDQFNLLLASGDLPDIMNWNWKSFGGGAEKHIQDGTILKLNDLIAQDAPNLTRILNEHPDWKKLIMTDEGSMYVFPQILPDPILTTYIGLGIRKDWLDNLGLAVPTTIDEWHTVLTAFKTKDPNGNGKADEIPFSPFMWGAATGAFDNGNAFMSAWGVTWNSWQYTQKDGKVYYGPMQPEYKEFLTTMNQWYKEGLIDKDYAAVDQKLFDSKFADNKIGAITCAVGSGIGQLTKNMLPKNPKFSLAGAPYPVLKAGDKPILGQRDPVFSDDGPGGAISKNCKHPVEAAKWLDYCYSDEGHMLLNFGIEGVSYTMVDGYPKYTDLITKNPQGLSMAEALAQQCVASIGTPRLYDGRYMEQFAELPVQKEALKIWSAADASNYIFGVSLTSDETTKMTAKKTDIDTFRLEQFHKFVMGAQPISDFDKYVSTLKQMGIDDVIAIEQAGLDRLNAKK